MTTRTWCAALAALTFFSNTAHADERAAATPPDADAKTQREAPDWLFGIGATVGGVGIGGVTGPSAGIGSAGALAGLAGAGGIFPSTFFGAGVERRLGPALWLTGQLGGSLQNAEADRLDSDQHVLDYFIDGRIGLRHVLNPDDRIQFSLGESVGAFYARRRDEVVTPDEVGAPQRSYGDNRSWGVHLDLAAAVDFWITETVAVRVGSRALTLGYQRTRLLTDRSDVWFAALELAPFVGLELGLP